MTMQYIIMIVTGLLSFTLGFAWLYTIAGSAPVGGFDSWYKKRPFLPLYLLILCSFCALYFLLPDRTDFVADFNFSSFLIPLLLAFPIFITALFSHKNIYQIIVILFCSVAASFTLPESFRLFEGYLPFYLDRALIVLIWFAFTYLYKFLNGIDGMIISQSLAFTGGIFALSLFGGTPLLLGFLALNLMILGMCFQIFNWYPAKLTLLPSACQALGFIIAWLLFRVSVEGAAPCCLIFSMIYLVEMAWSALQKVTLRDRFQNFYTNTFYYQTNLSGMSPNQVCIQIIKAAGALIIFGCFELFAPNAYSLPIFTLFIIVWYLHRLLNWQQPLPTVREMNRELYNDVKDNLNKFKDDFNNKDR